MSFFAGHVEEVELGTAVGCLRGGCNRFFRRLAEEVELLWALLFVEELAELESAIQLLQLVEVGFMQCEGIQVETDGHLATDGGQPLALPYLLLVLLHLFP